MPESVTENSSTEEARLRLSFSALQPKAAGPLYSLSLAYRRLGRAEESERLMAKLKHLQAEPAKPSHDGMAESLVGTEDMAR